MLYLASGLPIFCGNTISKKRRAYILGVIGFATQTLAMFLQYVINMESPASNSYGLVLSIAWIIAAVELAIPYLIKNGNFTMLPTAILVLLPLSCPMFSSAIGLPQKSAPSFAMAHGLLAAISYAALAVSAIFGGIYLKQRNSLRQKLLSDRNGKTPSLEILERCVMIFVSTSATIMFAAVIAGIIATRELESTKFLTLKFVAGSTIFILQIALCVAALSGIARGAKLSKFAIVLFVIAIITLIPIEIRTAI